MEEAKIQFSRTEMELMNNAEVILTKNRVLQKIRHLLEGLQNEMVQEASRNPGLYYSNLLHESPPKISRGENYLGLPYLVLDYPRQFNVLNIFAIRTMFWWGNFFSSTLQLAGEPKEEYRPAIEAAYEDLARNKYYIAIHEDPWQHHFDEDYYQRIDRLAPEEFTTCCRQFDHIKIATKWPLRDAHFVAEDLLESWNYLLKICLDK